MADLKNLLPGYPLTMKDQGPASRLPDASTTCRFRLPFCVLSTQSLLFRAFEQSNASSQHRASGHERKWDMRMLRAVFSLPCLFSFPRFYRHSWFFLQKLNLAPMRPKKYSGGVQLLRLLKHSFSQLIWFSQWPSFFRMFILWALFISTFDVCWIFGSSVCKQNPIFSYRSILTLQNVT